ncbi:MAG TPA: hypothetical protein VF771_09865 [Longimicrobiaceae bacterium]
MGEKLALKLDELRVESYETGDVSGGRGTVRARELAEVMVTRTNCLTTPCCPETLTCPQ